MRAFLICVIIPSIVLAAIVVVCAEIIGALEDWRR